MSQLEIAEILGVDKQTVSRWERGERRPRADTFQRMMAIYRERIDVGNIAPRVAEHRGGGQGVFISHGRDERDAAIVIIAILSAVAAALAHAYHRGEAKEIEQRELAFDAAADNVFGGDVFLKTALKDGLLRDIRRPKSAAGTQQKSEDGSV